MKHYHLISSVGASFGHRLGRLLPSIIYMQRHLDLARHTLHFYWNPIGSVGCLSFEQLFALRLPFVKIHSLNYNEQTFPLEFKTSILLPFPLMPEIRDRQLCYDYVGVDRELQIQLLDSEKGSLDSLFKLAPDLNRDFEHYREAFSLDSITGFQIRCREDVNDIINRASIDSQKAVADKYLELVNNQPFFFCTDSAFIERYIVSQRPDAFYVPKHYSSREGTLNFVDRGAANCRIAAIEFFCLLYCKRTLPWLVGGWTQYRDYLRP